MLSPKGKNASEPRQTLCVLCQPCLLFFLGEHFRLYLECILPCTFCQHVHIFIRNVHVNCIVTIRTANTVYELQAHNLGMLTQPPDVCLIAGKTCAVDTGLLSGTDTDCLTVLNIAYGVRLGILQRNQGNQQIVSDTFPEFPCCR